MKIVGYQTKGNVIRFYLGSPDLKPKYPKVKNSYMDICTTACTITSTPSPITISTEKKAPGIYPYSDFITGYRDVVVAWGKTVFTNDDFVLFDIMNQITPLLVIVNSADGDTKSGFERYKGAKDAICYYFWDDMEPDQVGMPDNYPGAAIDD